MLSDLIVIPPETATLRRSVERLKTRKSMFDVIFDSSMDICDRYGIVGPVGEVVCQLPVK